MISVYTFCDNAPMDTMGKRLKWAREQAGFKISKRCSKKAWLAAFDIFGT